MRLLTCIFILQSLILIYCHNTYILHSDNQNCDNPSFGLIYSGCMSLGNFSSISATCTDNSRYTLMTCPRLECTSPCRSKTLDGTCHFQEGVYKKMQCGGVITGGIIQSYSDPLCTKPDAPRVVYLTDSCAPGANKTSFQYVCQDVNTLVMHQFENPGCDGTPQNTKMILKDTCEFFGNNFAKLLTCGTYEGDNMTKLQVKKEPVVEEKQEEEAEATNFVNFNLGLASLFLLLLCNIL